MNLCIMDLEWTSWDSSEIKNIKEPKKEIIQLSLLIFNLKSMNKLDIIDFYVKPKINPKLSKHIIKLTGLNQKFIENNGYNFKTIFEKLLVHFNKFNIKTILANGSDWEILLDNCSYNNITFKSSINSINLKKYFMQFFNASIDEVQSNRIKELFSKKTFNKYNKIHDSRLDVSNIYDALVHIKKNDYNYLKQILTN